METIKKISALDPRDRSVIERLFGKKLGDSEEALLILRVNGEQPPARALEEGNDDIPSWFHVLEGFTDEDLAEFDAILKMPVRLAHDSE